MASTDKIHLDLDAEERDISYEPFVFTWKGETIELSDPAELDFTKLVEIETPIGFLKYTASQDARDFLASHPMEGWRLGKLIDKYYKHFGMDKQRQTLGF